VKKKELAELIKRVAHQRKRTGIANPNSVGYVRFTYACKPGCVRCALEKAIK
jgi:hypothetical protein